ncbi:MAG: hypothetical protein K5643_07460, partial [Saccharofermentans sp.]|nr:hypothetical protein [Saccharofermentans sp.]
MKSLTRKLTAFLSALLVVGIIAPNMTFFIGKNGFGSRDVMAASPKKYDAASAVNFATILGRAVDFGIVAREFHQKQHMETTFAIDRFRSFTDAPNEVDFINNQTANFLLNKVEGNKKYKFGQKQTAVYYNLEGSAEVLRNFNGKTGAYITSDYNFNTRGKASLVWRESKDVVNNINAVIDNVNDSRTIEINNRAKSDDYKLPADHIKVTRDKITINIDSDEFENRVVYIDVTDNMVRPLGNSDGVVIKKRASTVVVFNVGSNVRGTTVRATGNNGQYQTAGNGIHLNKMHVEVNGQNIYSTTGSMGGNYNDERNTNKQVNDQICEKIIWNFVGPRVVELENTAGTFLIANPNASVNLTGSTAGWIVSGGHMENNAEWHYIYTGGSQTAPHDEKGQIHFSARKAFTEKYAVKANIKEDRSIVSKAKDYKFNFYRSDKDYSSRTLIGTAETQTTNTIEFKTIQFYTDRNAAVRAGALDYYIANGETKPFYFVIDEQQAGVTHDGIINSTGYVTIKVEVTNKANALVYHVTNRIYLPDEKHPGQFIVYDSNDGKEMTSTRFELGALYNKIEPITVNISKRDINKASGELPGATLIVSYLGSDSEVVLNDVNLVRDGVDVTDDAVINKTSVQFVSGTEETSIVGLKPGNYSLRETFAPTGYKTQTSIIYFTVNEDKTVSVTSGRTLNSNVGFIETNDTVVILDDVYKTDVTVKKTRNTASGARLGDAVLKVTAKDSNVDFLTLGVTATQNNNRAIDLGITSSEISFKTVGNADTVIHNLPDGVYTLTEEQTPYSYITADPIEFTISKGVVSGGSTIVMVDVQRPWESDLKVTKIVRGDDGFDPSLQFKIRIDFTEGNNGFKLTEDMVSAPHDFVISEDGHSLTAYLAHGEELYITGLIPGTVYNVVEEDIEYPYYTQDGYWYCDTSNPHMIHPYDTADCCEVYNKYKTPAYRDIEITKSIDGLNVTYEELNGGITFEVTTTVGGATKWVAADGTLSD